jgi:hypothetical protein
MMRDKRPPPPHEQFSVLSTAPPAAAITSPSRFLARPRAHVDLQRVHIDCVADRSHCASSTLRAVLRYCRLPARARLIAAGGWQGCPSSWCGHEHYTGRRPVPAVRACHERPAHASVNWESHQTERPPTSPPGRLVQVDDSQSHSVHATMCCGLQSVRLRTPCTFCCRQCGLRASPNHHPSLQTRRR